MLPIVLRSLLTTVVSTFETAVGQIVKGYFEIHPEALGDGKEFSLADLRGFGSIADAQSVAIEARVDEFLRDSFGEWNDWFRKRLKLPLEEMALDYDSTVEVVLRRHLIVHTSGRVSRQYLTQLPTGLQKPNLGEHLTVDADYFRSALDSLGVMILASSCSTWAKVLPKDAKTAAHEMHERIMDLMIKDRWRAVQRLCQIGHANVATEDADRLIYTMNELLARKHLEGVAQIQTDVEAVDVSAAALTYRAVKLALLDRHDEALDAVTAAISGGELTLAEVESWPVFSDVRASPNYVDFVRLHRAKRRRKRATSLPTGDDKVSVGAKITDSDGASASKARSSRAKLPSAPPKRTQTAKIVH